MVAEPLFVATREGAEAAWRAGRRRRALKVSGLSSSTFAVGLVTALLLTAGPGPGAPDRLVVDPDPTPSPTATAAPSPTEAPDTDPSPTSSPQDPEWEGDEPDAPEDAVVDEQLSAETPDRVSPITRVEHDMAQTDLCDGGASTGVNGYCVRALAPDVVRRGSLATLGGEICVPVTGRAVTIHLSSTREADIRVGPSEAPFWEGGEGLAFASPGPVVVVDKGRCVSWTARWDTRDRDGFVVPPGEYDLSFAVPGSDLSAGVGGTVTVAD